jgi:hypothetical protein
MIFSFEPLFPGALRSARVSSFRLAAPYLGRKLWQVRANEVNHDGEGAEEAALRGGVAPAAGAYTRSPFSSM